jgi:hypothetical protein
MFQTRIIKIAYFLNKKLCEFYYASQADVDDRCKVTDTTWN